MVYFYSCHYSILFNYFLLFLACFWKWNTKREFDILNIFLKDFSFLCYWQPFLSMIHSLKIIVGALKINVASLVWHQWRPLIKVLQCLSLYSCFGTICTTAYNWTWIKWEWISTYAGQSEVRTVAMFSFLSFVWAGR